MSFGHIARSCCYVVPVALLNKELRRQYCDTINVEITCKLGGGPHLGICYGIAVWGPGSGRLLCSVAAWFRGPDWEFCFDSHPFVFNAGSLTFSVDSTAFSFLLFSFYLYVCILLFYLSVWFSPWVRLVLSSVSRVVITDCSSLVNFLRICVITPCYVIIFVMFCYLLYCKLI